MERAQGVPVACHGNKEFEFPKIDFVGNRRNVVENWIQVCVILKLKFPAVLFSILHIYIFVLYLTYHSIP